MINVDFSWVSISTLIAAVIGVVAARVLWNRRPALGSASLSFLFLSISFWSFSYAIIINSPDLADKYLWLKIGYLGITSLPVFWLMFCLRYTGSKRPSDINYFLIVSWIPLITLGLGFTNQHHQLLWSDISFNLEYGGLLEIKYGPWFWAHVLYSHFLYLLGLFILVKHALRTRSSLRRQTWLVISAGIIPGVVNYIYLIFGNPFPYVDLTTLSFAVSGIIIVYVLHFRRFLNIVPIARETTIENMQDGIIVVDLNDRVVDINPAAEKIVQISHKSAIGRLSTEVLSDLADWISYSKEEKTPVKVITIGEGANKRIFVLNLLPLSDNQEKLVGYTIIFHDNTESYTLNKDLEEQAERLRVLYEIGKAITTTLNVDSLLELIYTQLSQVIRSDAYFVALYIPETHQMDIRVLYDEGKRYPPAKMDASQGLSSWVVENKKPLLIQDLRKEMEYLPVKPILVGEKRLSRSWLGVPLITENEMLGLIAVASYTPNMFDDTDKMLMEQIGQQAVLSIKNARHYEEVMRQAKLDSLTGVYNHNHFIEMLYQEGENAIGTRTPISLIMLDIDHFKLYNDTYGHTIGDQVLRLTVQAIESHIKKTDTVGRWGGEEFGIILPNATTAQANMVANRIRRTLSELPLFNVEGQTIPKPTISQGIATIPEHTDDIDELVVIADRALYRAKDKGRDQVAVGIPSAPRKTPQEEA